MNRSGTEVEFFRRKDCGSNLPLYRYSDMVRRRLQCKEGNGEDQRDHGSEGNDRTSVTNRRVALVSPAAVDIAIQSRIVRQRGAVCNELLVGKVG